MTKYTQPLFPGKIYHVYNHAVGNDNLFYFEDNYIYFINLFTKYFGDYVKIYAYCLIPNHFHIVIRIVDEDVFRKYYKENDNLSQSISRKFSNFFNAYTKAFNIANNRKGPLFHRPFKRIEINSNDYLQQVIQYVHNNPVHHGLVTKISDWKHSSFFEILHSVNMDNYAEILDFFGGSENFISSHEDINVEYKKGLKKTIVR